MLFEATSLVSRHYMMAPSSLSYVFFQGRIAPFFGKETPSFLLAAAISAATCRR